MNKLIIDQFMQLIKQIKAEQLNSQVENNVKEINDNSFRLKAMKKIIGIIKKLDFEIKSADDLIGINGIGKRTRDRIVEIIENGSLSELKTKYNAKKQKKINSIQELSKVIGIGDRVARKLVVENNITSIDDLKKAIKNNKIKVNDQVTLGLKYYGIVQKDIPRNEITLVEKYLIKEAHKIDSKLNIMICGSYRRGRLSSGDIDVMLTHPDVIFLKQIKNPELYDLKPFLELFVDHLENNGFLLDHLTDNKSKYMGFCKYKNNPVRRIDIRFIPFNSIYAGMLYFTGPLELNEEMRSKAKKRGMLLNEYGLYKIDAEENRTLIPTNSEEAIFQILNMPYLTPIEREAYSGGKSYRKEF